jgi:N,N'-diacetyllegionaminate synthase
MTASFTIAGRTIGDGAPVFVIAEAGINHNGDAALATRLVEAAATAGADAVKFQSFTADGLISRVDPDFARIRELELPRAFHRDLAKRAEERGILFLSSAFAEADVDFLDALGVPAFKIASCEVTNLPLLEYAAGRGKPIILSTGFATLAEIETALTTLQRSGAPAVALLHCVSLYPAPLGAMNLRAIPTLRAAFGVPIGFSDHSLGTALPLAAVALGACIVEKHVTLDRALPGFDHQASIEPGELTQLVAGIRAVEQALGTPAKVVSPAEADLARAMRKSLVAERALKAGERIERGAVGIKRPGRGLAPALLRQVEGKVARRDVAAGQLLAWEDVTW